MKLWTCILTMGSRTTITQLDGQDANDALRAFISQKIIERSLGSDQTPWSEGAPHRRVFGPEMNEELVGAWDFEITGGDNDPISGLLIETVDQQWEIPEDEI